MLQGAVGCETQQPEVPAGIQAFEPVSTACRAARRFARILPMWATGRNMGGKFQLSCQPAQFMCNHVQAICKPAQVWSTSAPLCGVVPRAHA
eukprot:3394858-Amphidinium_carterae.5